MADTKADTKAATTDTPPVSPSGAPPEGVIANFAEQGNATPPTGNAKYRAVTTAFDFEGEKLAIGDVVDCSQWPNTEAMVQSGFLSHDVSDTPDGIKTESIIPPMAQAQPTAPAAATGKDIGAV